MLTDNNSTSEKLSPSCNKMRGRFMSSVFGVKYENGKPLCDPNVPKSSKFLTRQQYHERIALLEKWHSMPASTKEERAAMRNFKQKHRQGFRLVKLYRVETNKRGGTKDLRRLPESGGTWEARERKVCHAENIFEIIDAAHKKDHQKASELATTLRTSWWNIPLKCCEVYVILCPVCSCHIGTSAVIDKPE
jgi:hypothetical protein